MKKGYAEPSSTMRSRMAGSRGPQRFMLLALVLALAVVGLNYWRLMTVNADLTERVRRLDELLVAANTKWTTLEGERQATSDELLKAKAQLQKLQVDLEEKVSKLQEQADKLADMEDDKSDPAEGSRGEQGEA
ncbi:uncharacterized protein LOC119103976 [Pollicipes pollicipes]|uniref:uncharacterized protein LOC119103976 n=1 Tax=Pollicipes pollicipes TaxID=41117 RepID=UPI0018849886|nr:uncharacterized protein LOC119103976 [Pollicipes pollicipes]XP_037083584.1 uncharacterized protein LOC119103976 [Pollicipes pollicipes]XP_037083585.1 uncharacterized protein LOC119103976 [Pollicipes pollicipes]